MMISVNDYEYGIMQCPQYDLLNFGVFDTRIVMPKGGVSPERTVEHYELEFVTSCDKSALTFLDQGVRPLLPGTVICAKPGMKRRSRLHFKCYYIHFQTRSEELCRFLAALPDYTVCKDISVFTRLFEEFVTVDKSDGSVENRLKMQYFVSRILFELKALPGADEGANARTAVSHRAVLNNVERYIRLHLNEELELDTLSGIANLSPVYFRKIFCEFYGVSPAGYVLEQRIDRAKTLLLTTEKSMIEISALCGFSSQSYFTYKFKELCGISPLKYRKRMLSKNEI